MNIKDSRSRKDKDFYQNLTWRKIWGCSLAIAMGVPLILNVLLRVGNWIYNHTGYNISALNLGNVEWWQFYGSFLGGLFTLCAVFFTLKQNAKQNAELRELQIHTLISQFNEKELSHTKELVSNVVNSMDTALISSLREQVGTEANLSLIKSECFKLNAKQKESFYNLYLLTDINHDRTPCRGCKDCKTPGYDEYIEATEGFKNCVEKSADRFASTLNDFMKSIDMASFNLRKVEESGTHQKIVDVYSSTIRDCDNILKVSNNQEQTQIDRLRRITERDSHMTIIDEINKIMIDTEIIREHSEKVNIGIAEINDKLAPALFFSAKRYLSCKEDMLYSRTKMTKKSDINVGCKKCQDYLESKAKEAEQSDIPTKETK